jgi:uncharacterized OsmC-like protein
MSLGSLIADTRKAVDDDPANAQAQFTAQGTLVGVTEVDIRTGEHSFKVDEPAALGGADVAANPVQYALASLGSCQAITYQFWAEQLGIGFDSLSVRVEGDLDIRGFLGFDDSVRPGLSAVRVEVTVAGPESPERYQELAAAVDQHCPVLDLFANPVPVTRTLAS